MSGQMNSTPFTSEWQFNDILYLTVNLKDKLFCIKNERSKDVITINGIIENQILVFDLGIGNAVTVLEQSFENI